ncbi:hypothetical protein CBR_g68742 [Chara braunii]|uniref:Uncharacterized protein n=1 Tax=Chara braunii TaxID=69332 RepID=A0A388K9Q4_CHABU|nr:hypothetical protein CBR_g68742 [Chara braunii]|eukprot:GBG66756.1 hypothetical protein CBR_g68742 [Chara braunii]
MESNNKRQCSIQIRQCEALEAKPSSVHLPVFDVVVIFLAAFVVFLSILAFVAILAVVAAIACRLAKPTGRSTIIVAASAVGHVIFIAALSQRRPRTSVCSSLTPSSSPSTRSLSLPPSPSSSSSPCSPVVDNVFRADLPTATTSSRSLRCPCGDDDLHLTTRFAIASRIFTSHVADLEAGMSRAMSNRGSGRDKSAEKQAVEAALWEKKGHHVANKQRKLDKGASPLPWYMEDEEWVQEGAASQYENDFKESEEVPMKRKSSRRGVEPSGLMMWAKDEAQEDNQQWKTSSTSAPRGHPREAGGLLSGSNRVRFRGSVGPQQRGLRTREKGQGQAGAHQGGLRRRLKGRCQARPHRVGLLTRLEGKGRWGRGGRGFTTFSRTGGGRGEGGGVPQAVEGARAGDGAGAGKDDEAQVNRVRQRSARDGIEAASKLWVDDIRFQNETERNAIVKSMQEARLYLVAVAKGVQPPLVRQSIVLPHTTIPQHKIGDESELNAAQETALKVQTIALRVIHKWIFKSASRQRRYHAAYG